MASRIASISFVFLLCASAAAAQNPPAASPPPQNGATAFAKKAMALFDKPLHPIVKSVAPGGGFGPGVAYTRDRKTGGPWFFRTEAVITPFKYWNAEANLQYQNDWLHGELYGRARDMKRLDFYGIGIDAGRDNRSTYEYLDRSAGGLASVRFAQFDVLAVGARIEQLWPDIGPGSNPDFPSIEQRFSSADAPGLDAQPSFGAYTGFVNFNYPGGNALGRFGVDAQAAFSAYRDQDGGTYDFNRLNFESQQRLPGFGDTHQLTFHQFVSTTNPDAIVPFYLQYTLGGAGAVRGFHDEMIGSDSTKATLRGFQDLRFRGPNVLLLQAEYRLKLKGPIDATLFGDAGKVTAERSDLTLHGLKADYGVSLSFMTIDATALRLDIGTGGGEGVRFFFSVGPIFQR